MKMMLNITAVLAMTLVACTGNNQGNATEQDAAAGNDATAVTAPQFNADSAYNYTAAQCAFGPRVPGTQAHAQCAAMLQDKLKTWADSVILQEAPVTTFDGISSDFSLTSHHSISSGFW